MFKIISPKERELKNLELEIANIDITIAALNRERLELMRDREKILRENIFGPPDYIITNSTPNIVRSI
jgi:hypothetical protein